jgi:hypothetical protein
MVGVTCLRSCSRLDVNAIDPSAGRPALRPLDQLLQRLIVANRDGLDAAVAAISYPSRKA